MKIRICTPVVADDIEEFLLHLAKVQKISSFIELRVDSIEDFNLEQLATIKKQTRVKSIFTCRSISQGGKYRGQEKARVALLQNALENFEYVDIELETMRANRFTRSNFSKLIVSYHNFERTPSYWDMQKIIFEMNQYKPDILKIATKVNEEYEAVKLYRLLTNKPKEEERIVIGMGDKGKITRVLGPMLGGFLTYASTPWGESAEGQIDLKELEKIFEHF